MMFVTAPTSWMIIGIIMLPVACSIFSTQQATKKPKEATVTIVR